MNHIRHTAVVFDAFGTLIKPVLHRVSAHRRLADMVGQKQMPDRMTIMTRPVDIETLATEVGRPDVAPFLRREIDQEVAQLCLYDDVEVLLQTLRAAGLKLGVCSNLSADYGPVVRSLLPRLDAHVLSFEVGARKPEPAIYQAACRMLRCHPRDVLFVGDSPRADLQGPVAYGMTAVLVDRSKRTLGETVLATLRR